ncbi:hypothetical protein B0H14DRAFT_3124691 [Mycena olivaceomarginata]|nr:hypothetical protein B0H14DRAFT_3124691 [Mycena olivaceomarginata]
MRTLSEPPLGAFLSGKSTAILPAAQQAELELEAVNIAQQQRPDAWAWADTRARPRPDTVMVPGKARLVLGRGLGRGAVCRGRQRRKRLGSSWERGVRAGSAGDSGGGCESKWAVAAREEHACAVGGVARAPAGAGQDAATSCGFGARPKSTSGGAEGPVSPSDVGTPYFGSITIEPPITVPVSFKGKTISSPIQSVPFPGGGGVSALNGEEQGGPLSRVGAEPQVGAVPAG